MPRLRKCLGYHVRVEPDNWLHPDNPEKARVICESIADDIRRHIDNTRSIEVGCDTEFRCEFCGSAWTESSTEFNGGCCDEDMESEP